MSDPASAQPQAAAPQEKKGYNSFLERSKARHARARKQREDELAGLGGETTVEMGVMDTMDRRKVR